MSETKKEIEVVEKETEALTETKEVQTLNLFGSGDPQKAIERAMKIANAVADVIKQKELYVLMRGKAYVFCEGWTTMGALLGIFPQIVDVIDLSNETSSLRRYVAICETRTLDGRLVTRAESECSNEESTKKDFDHYAIRSMAETRATSKALRMCLSWIMKLAGYEPTPAEEVDEPKNIPKVIIKNGNDEVDELATELENEVPQGKEETIKMHMIRQITWILKKMKWDQKRFKEKVKNIDAFGDQTLEELTEIKKVLWNQLRHGITIKKIKPA